MLIRADVPIQVSMKIRAYLRDPRSMPSWWRLTAALGNSWLSPGYGRVSEAMCSVNA